MRWTIGRIVAGIAATLMMACAIPSSVSAEQAPVPDASVDPQGAFHYWRQRETLAASDIDRRADAVANQAAVLIALGRLDEASAAADRLSAMSAKRMTLPARQLAARLWLLRARINGQKRNYEDALNDARKAVETSATVFTPTDLERAQAQAEVASALFSLGRTADGLPIADAAWTQAQAATNGTAGERLGIAMIRAGGLSNARRSADAEAAIRAALPDAASLPVSHADRVQLFNRLGYELLLQGRMNEALPYLRRAVNEGAGSKAVPPVDLANYVGTLGIALLLLDSPEDAAPMFDKSLELFARGGVSGGQASILISAGTAADRAGNRERGLKLREQALALLAGSARPNPLTVALGRFKLGQSYAHLNRLAEAEAMEREAADAIAKVRPEGHFQRINSQIALGWIKVLRGDAPGGMALVKPAFARGLAESRKLEIAQSKVVGVLENIEAFSQALDAAVRAGDTEFAFEVMQILVESDASRAAAAASARQQAGGTALGALLRKRQETAAAAMAAENAADKAAAEDSADAADLRETASLLTTQARLLGAELDRRFPGYGALLRPTPVLLASARERLRVDEALLMTVASDEGLVTLALTRKGIAIGTAPIRRVAARALVSAIRAGTGPAQRPFDVGASHTLYQAIFTPDVAALTAKAKLLTISSDEMLSALPFSLLATRPADSVASAHWLIEDKAIAVAPSVAAMDGLQGRDRNAGTGRFVGIGAPSLAGSAPVTAGPSYYAAGETRYDRIRSMPPLPQARSELTSMARLWRQNAGTQLLMGDDASEAALRGLDLTHLSVLAFATHGLVAGEFDAVSEPALVLTPRPSANADTQDDGLLTASEAALLNIDADWIILSACNTAAGDRPSAAGYTGLARAFLFAGGRRVMASHWPVRDDVSARLTLATVGGAARGRQPAQALRQAMLALMRDTTVKDARNPAIWAPFMLVGR